MNGRETGLQSPSGHRAPRSARQRAFSVLKVVAFMLAVAFLVVAVARSRHELAEVVNRPDWLVLALLVVGAVATMVVVAVGWLFVLSSLGASMPVVRGVATFFVGETVKYIPGSLWPVIGRGELAVREGAPRSAAYTSVLLSLGYNYVVAAAVASALLAPFMLVAGSGSLAPLWLLAVLPLAALVVHPPVSRRLLAVVERVMRRDLGLRLPAWTTSLRLTAWYLIAWGLTCLTTFAATRLVDADLPLGQLAFAACIAWLAGFLVVPAPSGLGVREAVFAAVMSGTAPTEKLLAVAIVSRVAFVFADAIGAIVGALVMKLSNSPRSEQEARVAP